MRGGQTLAMKTWRTRLLMQDGASLTRKAVLTRFVIAALCYGSLLPLYILARKQAEYQPLMWISLVLFALPFLWALVDRDKQLMHDRLAKTRMVFFPKEVPSKHAKPDAE
jgi:uncharacterized RDD family membrane protein YckC